MRKTILFIGLISLFSVIAFIAACGSGSQPTAENPVQGKVRDICTASFSVVDKTKKFAVDS